MAAGKTAPAWRSAAVAIFLLPVVVPLALLCLPLLCFTVAVARFRRRRRRLRMAGKKTSGCCFRVREHQSPEGEGEGEGAGHRAALLLQYLEDQMELVGVVKAEDGDDRGAQRKKPEAPIGHENQSLAKLGDQD